MRIARGARALLGLGTFAIAGCAGGPAPVAASWQARLDAELAAIASDPAMPLASLSVLAIRRGEVVYHRQLGSRWIDNASRANDLPADEATLYRIASISKLVTALGVMKLVEAGVLDLDRDAGDYLGFALRNPHFPDTRITLRMLLAHTSSLRDEGGYFWPDGNDIREVLMPGGALHGQGAMWSRDAAPGTFFTYANLPWGVIGTVMERATGERFDRLMHRLVIAPLGLAGGFSPADMRPEQVRNIATLYRKPSSGPWVAQVDDYSKEPPIPRAGSGYVAGSNGTLFGPQGNLRASAADLGRIMRMLMNGGELEGRRFLRRASVDLMLSRQWTADGTNGRRDYGAYKLRYNAAGLGNQHFLDLSAPGAGDRLVDGGGFTAVGHLGDAWGLTGAFAFNRESRDGLVFLVGGPGFDPDHARGEYSSFYRYEERILTALYRRAVLGIAAP